MTYLYVLRLNHYVLRLNPRLHSESDPAVVAGVMTATLHPYSIALQRK